MDTDEMVGVKNNENGNNGHEEEEVSWRRRLFVISFFF